MRYGRIPGVDKPVSRLVHGTMMLRQDQQQEGYELLDATYAAGCRAWDTAHTYAGGQSERVLGGWVESRANRDGLVILTKGCHHSEDRRRVRPFDLEADIHDSLARLRTDYIDIFLLHRDDPAVEVGPLVEKLNEYHDAGRIRAFGGSNWQPDRIAAANEYADSHGLVPFTISSPNFSLVEPFEEPWAGCTTVSGAQNADKRAWYTQHGMPIFSWSSLAQGFLSGRITRDNWKSVRDSYPDRVGPAYAHEPNFRRLERAQALASDRGLTVAQVALAYVLQYPGLDVYALVGTFTGEQFLENGVATDVSLTEE